MQWKIEAWNEIDRDGLYALLQLRAEVFVVEQDCAYQDLDGKDEVALHVSAWDAGECVATARVLPPGVSYAEPSIGRVVVKESARLTGLGRLLMGHALAASCDRWPTAGVRISAQTYLEAFYRSLGFAPSSEPYLEDGLPHVQMFREGLPHGAWEAFAALPPAVDAWEAEVAALPDACVLGGGASWHAGAITHHLAEAEGATWAYLAKKGQTPVADLPPITPDTTARAIQLSAALRSTARFPMPEGLPAPKPAETRAKIAAVIARWRSAQADGRALVAALPLAWWDAEVFRHPLAGRLGLTMTASFLGDHIVHHRHQLKRLVGGEPQE